MPKASERQRPSKPTKLAITKTAAAANKPAPQASASSAKRGRRQAAAVKTEADRHEAHLANQAVLDSARVELLRFHKDAQEQKRAADAARHAQATKSYAAAADKAKKDAAQAEQTVHKKKLETLTKLLKQKPSLWAAGYNQQSVSGSKPKGNAKQSAAGTRGKTSVKTLPDASLCSTCQTTMTFCKDPGCLLLYCDRCLTGTANTEFLSCQEGHSCYLQASGPYCKRHTAKYLGVCVDCEVVSCVAQDQMCDGCNEPICERCVRKGTCDTCCEEWAQKREEYGIYSDGFESEENDFYGL